MFGQVALVVPPPFQKLETEYNINAKDIERRFLNGATKPQPQIDR